MICPPAGFVIPFVRPTASLRSQQTLPRAISSVIDEQNRPHLVYIYELLTNEHARISAER